MVTAKGAIKAGIMLPVLALPATALAKKQPNIIFFLIDDNGWVDRQVAYGGEVYPNNLRFDTPNECRLASEGVIFGNAYACPVSTPTRASLITGTNAARARITNWTSPTANVPSDAVGGSKDMTVPGAPAEGDRLWHGEWNWNGVSPVEGVPNTLYAKPLPQLLKEAGYYTIHVGKAHWAPSGTPGSNPYNMGFCVNVAGTEAGMPRSYQGRDNYGNTPEKWNYAAVQNMEEYYGTDTHLTEALTREALKVLDYPVSHGQPFYLYMAHYATHTPIQADERFFKKYRGRGMDKGQARYASMCEGVDKSLGDLYAYLEEHNLLDDTIIILMSDNGGNADVKAKGGVPHTQNAPLREGKGSLYEGGIRVPLAIRWPGKVKAGSRIDAPVMCEDLFPTMLHMAGISSYNVPQPVDGIDLVPVIRGKATPDPERAVIFNYPHKWKPEYRPEVDFMSSIRKGDWKLVYVMWEGRLELYNLREDIGETRDVASEHPDIVAALAKELSDSLRSWDCPQPIKTATGTPVPMADELVRK